MRDTNRITLETLKKVEKVLTNVKQKSYIRYEQIVKHIKLTLHYTHWI